MPPGVYQRKKYMQTGKNPNSRNGFKKGEVSGNNHPRWKGGVSQRTRIKYAPRPKPENCEVCGEKGRICLDHNHETGEFRGWICARCNITLGNVQDNPQILILLAEFLKKNGTKLEGTI